MTRYTGHSPTLGEMVTMEPDEITIEFGKRDWRFLWLRRKRIVRRWFHLREVREIEG